MNRGRNTLILLVLGAALGGYIYFVESKREPAPSGDTPPTPTLSKVFTVDADKIEEVAVTASAGDCTTLKKANNAWQLVAPMTGAADEAESSGLASSLASVEEQRLIDAQPKDLAVYGLDTPRIEVAFKTAADKDYRRLLIGDKTATGGNVYAKLGDKPRVFLVSSYLETLFDKTTFQLRDKAILKFDREKVDAIAVDRDKLTVQLGKQGEAWVVKQPWAARADFGAVESLMSRLSSGQMKSIVGQPPAAAGAPPQGAAAQAGATPTPVSPGAASQDVVPTPAALKQDGLDAPATRVTLSAGSATTGLIIGKATDTGDVYAKDVSRPMVFTVEKALADNLAKAPADYRMKNIFGFRAYTGTRLEVTRGGATVIFEKKKGTEKDAVEKWTMAQPARTVEDTKIDDLAGKVAGLRADSFVDAVPANAAEAARVATRFDDNKKQETVVIQRVGDDFYAVRGDEAGAAKLPRTEVEALFTALDDLQKAEPPKPAAK